MINWSIRLFLFLILFGCNKLQEKEIEGLLKKALIYRDNGRYDECILTLKKALNLSNNPEKSAELMMEIGKTFSKYENKSIAALEWYYRLVKSYSESSFAPQAQEAIGETYQLDLLSYRRAIEAYNEVLIRYPKYQGNPRVLYNLGRCYMLIGDFPQARVEFRRLVSTYPSNDRWKDKALIGIGEAYLMEGDISSALRELVPLRHRVKDDPTRGYLDYLISMCRKELES